MAKIQPSAKYPYHYDTTTDKDNGTKFVTPKKNSDNIRMCIDLSHLNRYVRRYYVTNCKDCLIIKTHDSESRGQEEAGRMQRTSELFTHSTALKFVNTLNKPP